MPKFLIPREGYTLRQQQELVDGLIKIAAYADTAGQAHFRKTSSYSGFDEPAAVARSRGLLLGTLRIKPEHLE